MDAKLELDAFQRQHDQISKSHSDLIARGRNISLEIEQSDRATFDSPLPHPHPAVVRVEGMVVRMVQARQRMEGVARPRLQTLKKCYQFHCLRLKTSKVSEVSW